MKSLGNESSP